MVSIPIPKRLSRNAVIQSFPRVRESNWRNLYNYEKSNGLYELRVDGPDRQTYYNVEKLVEWLMERSLYRRSDFNEPGELFFNSSSMHVTRHILAG